MPMAAVDGQQMFELTCGRLALCARGPLVRTYQEGRHRGRSDTGSATVTGMQHATHRSETVVVRSARTFTNGLCTALVYTQGVDHDTDSCGKRSASARNGCCRCAQPAAVDVCVPIAV